MDSHTTRRGQPTTSGPKGSQPEPRTILDRQVSPGKKKRTHSGNYLPVSLMNRLSGFSDCRRSTCTTLGRSGCHAGCPPPRTTIPGSNRGIPAATACWSTKRHFLAASDIISYARGSFSQNDENLLESVPRKLQWQSLPETRSRIARAALCNSTALPWA